MEFFMFWVGMIIATCVVAEQKNLGLGSYFILSLFLGPVALIMAILIPSRKAAADNALSDTGNIHSLGEAKQQLSLLKESAQILQKRIADFEESLARLSHEERPEPLPPEPTQTSFDNIIDVKMPEKNRPEVFELVFGKYWLSRIGVVLFVLGVAFFISYAFQYLNAFCKIGVGYALALAFLAGGHYLEKIERYKKVAWGILGGGWGLLYLSTYAMHYIEETRIITNVSLELFCLSVVSLLAVIYNLRYNSWVVTAMTFLLALMTAGLGGINYSTLLYWSLLLGGITYLSYRNQWGEFLLAGILGVYFTYLCWIYPNIEHQLAQANYLNIPVYRFQLSFGMLTMSWVVFVLALFLQKTSPPREKLSVLVAGQLWNAAAYIGLGLYEIYCVLPYLKTAADIPALFALLLAVMYFIVAFFYRSAGASRLVVVNSAAAFFLLGLAIYLKRPGLSLSFVWLLETMVLFIIGIYYRETTYRLLGWLLSFFVMARLFVVDLYSMDIHFFFGLVGLGIKHNILMVGLTAIFFFVFGAYFNRKESAQILPEEERGWYRLFPIAGTVLLTVLISEEVRSHWLSLSWTLAGVGLLAAGFLLGQRIYRSCALGVLSLTALRVVVLDLGRVNTIYKIIAFIALGAVLVGVSLIYSRFVKRIEKEDAV